MGLQITRSTDGAEAVTVGQQTFPVCQNPRQVRIPQELLTTIFLSELPDEIAVVPLGFGLRARSGQQPSCELYAFRDGSAWIRVGIGEPSGGALFPVLAAMREAVSERQKQVCDVEEDDCQDSRLEDRLFYIVAFAEDLTISDALARVGVIARQLDERCQEIIRARSAKSLGRGHLAAG